MRRGSGLMVFLLCLFLASGLFASPFPSWEGQVVGVSDGDTITVMQSGKGVRIRVYGIDAPESGQDYGQRAKQFVSDAVFKKTVRVEHVDTDRYGRIVGRVYVSGRCLSEALVQFGLAWVYPQYCRISVCESWKILEAKAQVSRRGLWADINPTPPWEFRSAHRSNTRETAPTTQRQSPAGAYKGNVKTKIFHGPNCRHYNCKDCTATFQARGAAGSAGYRPCKVCNP